MAPQIVARRLISPELDITQFCKTNWATGIAKQRNRARPKPISAHGNAGDFWRQRVSTNPIATRQTNSIGS